MVNSEKTESKSQMVKQSIDPRGRRSFLIFALVACVIFIVTMIVQLRIFRDMSRSLIGDGVHVASYQFDTSNLIGDADLLVPTALPRNGQPALSEPETWTPTEIDQRNAEPFKRVVTSRDMVIGVAINGEARAYPVRVMNWHEVVNDTLGGQAITITFSPLTRAAAVYRRELNGKTAAFAYSGLLYNHGLLIYDRQPEPADSSLWLQLGGQAIAGPSAGKALQALPFRLTTWARWREAHPQSDLVRGLFNFRKRYKRSPYADEFKAGTPKFPVKPLVSEGHPSGLHPVSMIAAWKQGDRWAVMPEPFAEGTALPDDEPIFYSRWFAWYALYGQASDVLSNPAAEALKAKQAEAEASDE